MNKKTVPNQAEKLNPETDASQLSPEVLDKIKHPPKMDDVIREQSATEKRGNQALVPEMLDEPSDIMTGYSNEQSG
ncbi:hypothetical protein H6G06_13715 [Anabaena sphaerica FACHB-251]|uniref:Uncharacterized protein n=1 Tax=Anabaena sphaerica FACHB-251 TaxID=2692883 RepID=A0A926WI31_9NOST|nr:hypothetical protein [Anabaena sphaerica]MBD2294505.1 hypothetical protein [Anabaena sphaerica FACHB-251]